MRHLTFNNSGQAPVNGYAGGGGVTTAGWAVQGKFKTFGSDSVQYAVTGGDGVGRYLLGAVNNTSAVINNGQLEGIRQQAFSLGYQRVWSPTWRSNLIYGQIKSNLPHPAVPLTTPSKVAALLANMFWTPVPNSLIGLEFERAEVTNDAVATPTLSNKGKNDRVSLSFQYGF